MKLCTADDQCHFHRDFHAKAACMEKMESRVKESDIRENVEIFQKIFRKHSELQTLSFS